jgi:hypothetical protein
MRRPVRVDTGFPSARKTAKKLGVSKKIARNLSLLAERSLKTGEFVLPGVGRIVDSRVVRDSVSKAGSEVPTKKEAKVRVSKSVKHAPVPPKKKKK